MCITDYTTKGLVYLHWLTEEEQVKGNRQKVPPNPKQLHMEKMNHYSKFLYQIFILPFLQTTSNLGNPSPTLSAPQVIQPQKHTKSLKFIKKKLI